MPASRSSRSTTESGQSGRHGPSPTRKTVRESDEPCPPCFAVEQQSGSMNPPSFPCPLPLTDPPLSSAASCRDAVVLPRWDGENRAVAAGSLGLTAAPHRGAFDRSPADHQEKTPKREGRRLARKPTTLKRKVRSTGPRGSSTSHARFKPSCATIRRSGLPFGRPTRHGCAGTGRHVSSVQGSGTTPGATAITSCQAGFFR
jgi:hypothetical protein